MRKLPGANRLLADEFASGGFHRAKPENEENRRFFECSTAGERESAHSQIGCSQTNLPMEVFIGRSPRMRKTEGFSNAALRMRGKASIVKSAKINEAV